MEDVNDSPLTKMFKHSCVNEDKVDPNTQNVNFPDSVCLVESALSIIVSENDSAFIETSSCSEISASSIKASETFSEISFNNNSVAYFSNYEHGDSLKADSGILESKSIADDSSKIIGFHAIAQTLSENSGDMTFDFNFNENDDQFDDNEFHSSIEIFNDPSFLNFLENECSSTVSSNPLVARDSLYQKFDPLYANFSSQYDKMSSEFLNYVKNETYTENSSDTLVTESIPSNTASLRQSIGNSLISFDSFIIDKSKQSLSENASVCDSQKLYTEDDLKKALEDQEFAIRGTFLRKQKDLEELFFSRMEAIETKFKKQEYLSKSLCIIIREAMHLVNVFYNKKENLKLNLAKAEKDKNKLKEDLDLFVNDLQNIERTFSDFHKEFEESSTMLKLQIKNESLKKQLENMKTQLNDKEKICKEFQNLSLEIVDKFNFDTSNKSGEV